MTTVLRLQLLGGLHIERNGAPLSGFLSNKVAALLVYLAVTRQRHQRESLCGLLWGEMPDADARNNLRQALSNLRKLAGECLVINRRTVGLNPDAPLLIDTEQFADHLKAANTAEDPLAELQTAASLYRGDFLAGFYVHNAPAFEEWMQGQRARYRGLALHALHTLTNAYLQRRNYPQAIETAVQLLNLDAWREEAHRQLMLALAYSGQRTAALAQYKTCRQILEKELDVPPSAETTALYERIRAMGRSPRHNLPPPSAPLIGRQPELERLRHWLGNPHSRLLTITGPGGVGKTHLALHVAWNSIDHFLEGVWFVPLAPVRKEEAVAAPIAATLGFQFPHPHRPEQQLLEYLRGKEMLLVLDNMEHLLSEQNLAFLSGILARSPGIKLLLTSRERLNLRAETLLNLDGLPCDNLPAAGNPLSPAVELFTARARQVQANFDPAEHKKALGRLCRAVDGLPLAIELAASWVQVMEVADILTQVEQHPDRLTARWRDQPPRHRSLLGVFEHSWRLLSPREQEAYLCLSVFRGEFTAEAARAVAGAGLSLLTGLVDKSLLRHKDGRYAAHPLLVQFAAGKLAGRPALYEQAKHRHARYYGDFTRQLEPVLLGGSLEKGLRRVRPELDDLRLAWQTALENRDVRLINNLADSFMQIFDMFGLYREIRDMAVRAIQALEGRVDPRQREDALALGRAYGLSAAFHFRLGDYEQALAHGQASLSLIAPFQPDVAYGHSLIYAGAAAYGLGEGEQAIAYWQKGVEAYRAAGSIWGETVANANLAEGTLSQEKPVEAEQYASRAYTLARRINNAELMAVALQILAVVALQQGNFEQATARGEQAVALHRQVGHRAHIANALAILARIDAARGDTQQALARLEESVVILRLLGNRLYLHQRLLELGQLAMKVGRWEMAEAALREITGQADSAGKTDVTSEALRLLAELHR